MKLPYSLLAVFAVLAAGCNKPAPTDVVSNSDGSAKPPVVAPATTDAGATATGTTGTTTTGTTTGTPPTSTTSSVTPPPTPPSTNSAPPPAQSTSGAAAPPTGSTPPPTNTAPPMGSAPPPTAPGQQPTLTDAQKKQLAEMQAQRAKALKENSAKAEKATKKVLPDVRGKYALDLDDTLAHQLASIDAAVAQDPSRKEKGDQFKAQIKSNIDAARKDPPTFTFDSKGNVVAHTANHPDVKGFTTIIDGKQSIVVVNPDVKAGGAAKVYVILTVKDGGKAVLINGGLFKKS